MSDLIPLYDPHCQLPDPPLQELHRTHWKTMQERAQEFLTEWLSVENDGGVLLFDRCTHALWAGIWAVCPETNAVWVPPNTYRAAKDAALMAERRVVHGVEPSDVRVPTYLWGEAPPTALVSGMSDWEIHDCAHVCYPGMFRGWKWERTMAALSFFPTKPCGAFGGGALIGPSVLLDLIRPGHFPIDPKVECTFTYPATIQSWGIIERCRRFDETYWARQRVLYSELRNWLCAYGFTPAGPQAVVTPHLLPFRRTPELERLCERAGLETGQHYPRLDTGQVENITIPFWSDEVLTRLNKALQDDGPTQRAACCPS